MVSVAQMKSAGHTLRFTYSLAGVAVVCVLVATYNSAAGLASLLQEKAQITSLSPVPDKNTVSTGSWNGLPAGHKVRAQMQE